MKFAVLQPSHWVDDPDYPDDDGKPMSDNTLQYDWIGILKWNLEFQFVDVPDVFVAGNLLWYPRRKLPGEEGYPPRLAPDAMVVFGRPKGYRGSYRQWEENDIPLTVVFEILSPSNNVGEMAEKLQFYDEYGVEEYYLIRPDYPATIEGWSRKDGLLTRIESINEWISPRLGIRFQKARGQMQLFHYDGTRFESPIEIAQRAEREHARAERERQRFAMERLRADEESERAEAEATRAETETNRAEAEAKRAEAEAKRAEALAKKLRELGVDPDAV